MAINVFTYWQDADRSVLTPFIEHWQAHFAQFRVLGDADVWPLINRYLPEAAAFYPQLQFPTAKADLARLVILYAYGGLYVDTRCAIRDPLKLSQLLDQLDNVECILVDFNSAGPAHPGVLCRLMNHILLAQPSCELLLQTARRVTKNLEWQYRMERRHGYVEYTAALTDGYVLQSMLFEPGSLRREMRPEFIGRVLIVPDEEMPIRWNYFFGNVSRVFGNAAACNGVPRLPRWKYLLCRLRRRGMRRS